MNRTDFGNLDLRGLEEVLPTVEVDTADDYSVSCACEKAIHRLLITFGQLERPSRVTVYVYEGPSINFGRMTNSIFFAVAGNERVLTAVHASLCAVAGAQVRFGDYIPAQRCVPRMHLEHGVLWLPGDANEWESVDAKQ